MLDPTEQQRLGKLYEQLRLKLLDLSRKNRMLNYSLGARSKRHLQIVDDVLEEVYRKLVGEEATLKIAFLSEPDDIPLEEKAPEFVAALEYAKVADIEYLTKLDALEREGRDDEIELAALECELRSRVRSQLGLPPRRARADVNRAEHARSLGIDPSQELQRERSKPSRDDQSLQTLKYPDELESVAEKIRDRARLAEQEMGVSTLFLAFGFLEWYESEDADKKAYAPLLLLPVKLERRKVRGRNVYYLSTREGEAEANLSLQKLLSQKYNRELPNFDFEEEGAIGSIEGYLDRTRAAIDGLKRWQIRRWLVLGHFAFGRFAIYADLKPENWRQHPVVFPLVKAILRGSEQDGDGELLPPIPDDYAIDDPEIEKIAPFLIHDADASQHSALVDVMHEKNLVIQGPPGTGKSQTITNIIANVLAAGKRVLFLAEKRAALDVVKRRLDRAGLGEFCLELHSDRASPKLVIESLKRRANLGWGQTPHGSAHASNINWINWHESRREIAGYLGALHLEIPDGATPFTLIWKALRGRAQNADVIETCETITLSPSLLADAAKIAEVHGRVAVFAKTAMTFTQAFQHPAQSPWAYTPLAEIPRYETRRLITTLTDLRTIGLELVAYLERYADDLGVAQISDIEQLIAVDGAIGDPPETPLVETIATLDLDELEKGLATKHELIDIDTTLRNKPDLTKESPSRLALATALAHSGISAALLQKTPAELYAIANDTIAQLRSLIEISEALLPILQVLNIDKTFAASGLNAIAIAAIIASKITPQNRSWIGTLRDIDERAFSAAYSSWSAVAASEREWRQELNAYGAQPWPSPTEIEIAAKTFRKGALGKAFALFTGTTRAAGELILRLGLPKSSPNLPDELDRLARHVRALADFESDGKIAELMAEVWKGFSTPFDNVAAAIKLRNLIRGELGLLSGGDRVASQMLSMDPDELANVGRFAAIGQRFRASSAPLRHWFDERSIDALMSALRAEIVIMQRALDIDRDYALAGLYLPVKEIAEIAALLAQRERLVQTLSRSTLVHAIEHFGRSIAEIEQANNAIDWIRSVHQAAPQSRLRQALTSSTASEARRMLREASANGAALYRSFTTLMTRATQDFGMSGLQSLAPGALVERLGLLLAHQSQLADFLAICDQRRELEAIGLSDMLACADRVALSPDRLPSLFETLVAKGRADQARRAAPALERQNGATLDARRRIFAECDRKKIDNDRSAIRTNLLQKNPLSGTRAGPRGTWTEMALLRNEFGKDRRFTPLRGLLSRAKRSIQVLKPCFMMSPLSVAKFVRPDSLEFDVLLIDEASQMKPEDALGGMLRAKQIVVVGDSKQLPPTDFFTRSEDAASSDDGFEDIDDESILEGCQKTFGTVRRLKWHYRSRCESLIAFSNAEFYRDSPLITFPTARPGSFSIDLVRVDGPYQARRNVAEAVRMAEEAIQFMRHFADASEESIPTLGLATVNIEQRDLIQEELRRLSAADELVDQYCEKVEKKGEPLFVKNLENVQGDERDFIFISLTYGREPGATVMKQRFGPINGKQGHRRLNVLFSRARDRIVLFTSFGSADVRPSGTSAEGVHVLKRYLEYAERRGLAVERIGSEPDSDFEVEVRDRLRSRGYEIDSQVGVSGYRIDLGVRHPDNPEAFLAGIECDGASYHGIPSARDRDRLREEVLRGLGWEILRVWSTDWFDDPGVETEKLVKKLEQLRSQPPRTFNDYCIVVKGSEPQEEPVDELILQENIADGAGAAAATNEGAPPPSAPTSEPAVASATSLLADDSPLSEAQAFKALEEFRETIIMREMTDWEPHRSILRDGMIETFVRQRVTDPDEWFRKVPHFQRSGTNPVEKNLFLSRICDIVDRIEEGRPATKPKPNEPYTLTSSTPQQSPTEPHLPLGAQMNPVRGLPDPSPTVIEYVIADMAELGITPRADRFYDSDYAGTIRRMVAHVIEVEGPIYDDLLVARIARAHRFQRSGSNIQQRVLSAIDRRFPRSEEDGRKVLWREGSRTDAPIAYRSGSSDVRSHWYIPIAELASLAIPYVRLRMDDEQVLRKMADHFELGRLREATRRRFQRAISLAKSTLTSRR